MGLILESERKAFLTLSRGFRSARFLVTISAYAAVTGSWGITSVFCPSAPFLTFLGKLRTSFNRYSIPRLFANLLRRKGLMSPY
jgi:hypothetical protein